MNAIDRINATRDRIATKKHAEYEAQGLVPVLYTPNMDGKFHNIAGIVATVTPITAEMPKCRAYCKPEDVASVRAALTA